MNNRGSALAISVLAVLLLTGYISAMFMQSVGESSLEHRQADATSALWLAEAGLARVVSLSTIPSTVTTGSLANASRPANTYTFSVSVPTFSSNGCYTIESTGIVASPASSQRRTISATLHIPDASTVGYAVETTSNTLCFGNANNCNKTAATYLSDTEHSPPQLAKTSSTKTFQSFFGVSTAAMKAWAQSSSANIYTSSAALGNTIAAKGVTWVDVPAGQTLAIQHLNNLSGPSIVIINGNFTLNGVAGGGGSEFEGILYVIGTFTMSGNASISGTTFIESAANIQDDFTGSASVGYNSALIAQSLGLSRKSIVSWKEK